MRAPISAFVNEPQEQPCSESTPGDMVWSGRLYEHLGRHMGHEGPVTCCALDSNLSQDAWPEYCYICGATLPYTATSPLAKSLTATTGVEWPAV